MSPWWFETCFILSWQSSVLLTNRHHQPTLWETANARPSVTHCDLQFYELCRVNILCHWLPCWKWWKRSTTLSSWCRSLSVRGCWCVWLLCYGAAVSKLLDCVRVSWLSYLVCLRSWFVAMCMQGIGWLCTWCRASKAFRVFMNPSHATVCLISILVQAITYFTQALCDNFLKGNFFERPVCSTLIPSVTVILSYWWFRCG